jgi:hypothetical protein
MPDDVYVQPFSDQEFLQRISRAHWHRSKGYARGSDGAQIGAHEYIVKREEPILFPLLRDRVRYGPGGYDGMYKRWRHHYLNLGGYKYWATFEEVLNREALPDHDQSQLDLDVNQDTELEMV